MSALVFTGASQFAAVGVVAAGGAMFPRASSPSLRRGCAAGAKAGALSGGTLALAVLSWTPAGVPILAAALGVVPAVALARRSAAA
jgi:hypothetical protein